jgi:hypothetical protein
VKTIVILMISMVYFGHAFVKTKISQIKILFGMYKGVLHNYNRAGIRDVGDLNRLFS